MSIYADSGFICSVYAPDLNTDSATAFIGNINDSISFSWLNQVEFRNALRLRVFRREITAQQRDASLSWLLSDIRSGVFVHAEPLLSDLIIETERLSALYSEKLGTRSLDVLHVAMAITLGCQIFLSFDNRQLRLAVAVGLKVPTI